MHTYRFVKKQKLDDGNLLKTERGDKLKEIAGLSAADYEVEWSERQNEIQLPHPHPGFINGSAQVVASQVSTLPKAKRKPRSKQNKDMHKCSRVYSERGVPLPVLTSGGE